MVNSKNKASVRGMRTKNHNLFQSVNYQLLLRAFERLVTSLLIGNDTNVWTVHLIF